MAIIAFRHGACTGGRREVVAAMSGVWRMECVWFPVERVLLLFRMHMVRATKRGGLAASGLWDELIERHVEYCH